MNNLNTPENSQIKRLDIKDDENSFAAAESAADSIDNGNDLIAAADSIDNGIPLIVKSNIGVTDKTSSLSFENSATAIPIGLITPSVSDPLKVSSINLLPFDTKRYEESKLQAIIENEDDELNINHYKNDSTIRGQLKSMR